MRAGDTLRQRTPNRRAETRAPPDRATPCLAAVDNEKSVNTPTSPIDDGDARRSLFPQDHTDVSCPESVPAAADNPREKTEGHTGRHPALG